MRRVQSSWKGFFGAFALLLVLPVAISFGLSRPSSSAQEPAALRDGFKRGSETGLPVPRFVSLRARKARMRVGPSTDYATRWIYQAPGLPLEITEEYGHWRRVRDSDGASGWMYGVLLSGQRTGLVGPWLKTDVTLRAGASAEAAAIALLQPKVRLQLSRCDGSWCHVHLSSERLSGYVRQTSIWGVYPGEVFG